MSGRHDPQRTDDGAPAGWHGSELKRDLPGPRVSPGLLTPHDPGLHLLLWDEATHPCQVCSGIAVCCSFTVKGHDARKIKLTAESSEIGERFIQGSIQLVLDRSRVQI